MFKKMKHIWLTAFVAVLFILPVKAEIQADYDNDGQSYNYGGSVDRIVKIDRYLDVEVWTNNTDNEFYVGDNIVLNFRANRDAFVAIYSIDTKGRVNLLFPASRNDDNFVAGGETYRLPDYSDDFDFVVAGPEGVETIQIIASKERFPIPDWYPNSGIVMDIDDRFEFADYVNSRYFLSYDGQRFAFDRESIYINEWEDYYYRPVYYPDYPSWTVYGNVYIDYPYGASVYINGVYWGCAPLYIPRIWVGWHTVTLYDRYGHCWEHDMHISRYNTVVLDRTIVRPSPSIRSKYKEVRTVGYRDPVKNGYPNYKEKKIVRTAEVGSSKIVNNKTTTEVNTTIKKKYVRGSTELTKTSRGYETTGKTVNKRTPVTQREKALESSSLRYEKQSTTSGTTKPGRYEKSTDYKSTGNSYDKSSKKESGSKSSNSYRKSTGSKSSGSSKQSKTYDKSSKKESSSGSKNSGSYKKEAPKKSSDSKSSGSKSSGSSKKSGSSKSSDSKGSSKSKKK